MTTADAPRRLLQEVQAELEAEEDFQEAVSSEVTGLFAQVQQLKKELRDVRAEVQEYAGRRGDGAFGAVTSDALAAFSASSGTQQIARETVSSHSSVTSVTSRSSVSSYSGDTVRA